MKQPRLVPLWTTLALLPTAGASCPGQDLAEPRKPQLLAEGRISRGHEYCTSLTPDGQTLYFVRTEKEQDSIWVTRRDADGWTEPQVAEFSGVYDDTDPMITADGSRLFFMSRRLPGGGMKDDHDIWVMDREGSGWGAARLVSAPISLEGYFEGFPCETSSGAMYFFRSREKGHTPQDIYRAPRLGEGYGPAQKLPAPINTSDWDGHAWVDPEERWMVFYSNRAGGLGRCDLYASRREGETWSQPINLGPHVNSEESEITPWVDTKNGVLYFSRIHADGGRDIYFIELAHTPLAALMSARSTDEPQALGGERPRASFEKLKELVGEWEGHYEWTGARSAKGTIRASYRLTGHGSAVVEDLIDVDSGVVSMTSIYHMDGDHLRMTHYCAADNQPRLIATSLDDAGTRMHFDLVDVTNLKDPGPGHVSEVDLDLGTPARLEIRFKFLHGGKESVEIVQLKRVIEGEEEVGEE